MFLSEYYEMGENTRGSGKKRTEKSCAAGTRPAAQLKNTGSLAAFLLVLIAVFPLGLGVLPGLLVLVAAVVLTILHNDTSFPGCLRTEGSMDSASAKYTKFRK